MRDTDFPPERRVSVELTNTLTRVRVSSKTFQTYCELLLCVNPQTPGLLLFVVPGAGYGSLLNASAAEHAVA